MHLTTSHTDHFFQSHIIFDLVFKRSGDRYISKATTSETTSLVHLINITHYLFTSASLIITLPVHFLWKNEKNETINSNSLGGSITYGSNCLSATCCHSLQWCGTSSHRSLTIEEEEMTSLKKIDLKKKYNKAGLKLKFGYVMGYVIQWMSSSKWRFIQTSIFIQLVALIFLELNYWIWTELFYI